MKEFSKRLEYIVNNRNEKHTTVMIIGLGSVGTYLLDYLVSSDDPNLNIVVVGRNYEKMVSDVNIVRVGALIRQKNKSHITIESGVDLDDVGTIVEVLAKYNPDFVVNSSRVYAGLKYGSISWKNIRAYGIWSPLAIKYIRNISEAFEEAECDGILINTSYSDAVIPWLKTAQKPYPDFGSGNINHLVPRIKYAVANMKGIVDFWNIEVMFATAHFHDVVISKEGHTEGMEQLLQVSYQGQVLDVDQKEIFKLCSIPMPVDAKRNMMNASSNYNIIQSIIDAAEQNKKCRFFSPGVFGEIGGYPVSCDGTKEKMKIEIDTSVFTLEQMRSYNRQSIALDGIENVIDGTLIYTDDLLAKTKKAFGVDLPKKVHYDDIDEVANFIIEQIIKPNVK